MAQTANAIATINEAMDLGWDDLGVFNASLFNNKITSGSQCIINDPDVLEVCGVECSGGYNANLAIKWDDLEMAEYCYPKFRLDDIIGDSSLTLYQVVKDKYGHELSYETSVSENIYVDSNTNTLYIGFDSILAHCTLNFVLYIEKLPIYHNTVQSLTSSWDIEFDLDIEDSQIATDCIVWNEGIKLEAQWNNLSYPGNVNDEVIDEITLSYQAPNNSRLFIIYFNIAFCSAPED